MTMTLKPKETPDTLPAKDMAPGKTYITCNKPGVHCPIRILKWVGKEVEVEVYQANVDEWKTIRLPSEYKVRHIKETEMKLTKKVAAPASGKVSKTKGKTTGVGIFDTWHVAFKKHGKDPKAVVQFMKDEYPGRTTDWSKWANGMRQRYNRGLLGPKPETPLAPYHTNGKAEPKKKIAAKK